MTVDPFTAAARAEAEERLTWHDQQFGNLLDPMAHMAEWARTYLAEQEPTHEEVIAATLELYVRSHRSTGRQAPFESLGHEEQVSWVMDGRAVLSAARAVGRDEKDTP